METNIKSVRVLPLEEMFFLKKINLDDASSSVVCYARKVSKEYKLNTEGKIEGEHLYLENKESKYPSDELDKQILEQIQEKFPNAKVQSSLMMLDVEKEDNAQWLGQYDKSTLKVFIECVPVLDSLNRLEPIYKEIEVLYSPTMRRMQRRLNANIYIVTDSPEKYRRLCFLLNDTYDLFSKVCEIK